MSLVGLGAGELVLRTFHWDSEEDDATAIGAKGDAPLLLDRISPRQAMRLAGVNKFWRERVERLSPGGDLPGMEEQRRYTKERFFRWVRWVMPPPPDLNQPDRHDLVGLVEAQDIVSKAVRDEPVVVTYAARCTVGRKPGPPHPEEQYSYSRCACFRDTPGAEEVEGLLEADQADGDRIYGRCDDQAFPGPGEPDLRWNVVEEHWMTLHVTLISKFRSEEEAVAAAEAAAMERRLQAQIAEAAATAAASEASGSGWAHPPPPPPPPPLPPPPVGGGAGGGAVGLGGTPSWEYPVEYSHMCLDCREWLAGEGSVWGGLRWRTDTL
jgi:hypothetical protein